MDHLAQQKKEHKKDKNLAKHYLKRKDKSANSEELEKWLKAVDLIDSEFRETKREVTYSELSTVLESEVSSSNDIRRLGTQKLTSLLEKLKQTYAPNFTPCSYVRNALIRAIYSQQVAWEIDSRFGLGTLAADDWLSASHEFWKDSLEARTQLAVLFGIVFLPRL